MNQCLGLEELCIELTASKLFDWEEKFKKLGKVSQMQKQYQAPVGNFRRHVLEYVYQLNETLHVRLDGDTSHGSEENSVLGELEAVDVRVLAEGQFLLKVTTDLVKLSLDFGIVRWQT